MRNSWKWVVAGSSMVLASHTALADDGIGFSFSISVPGVPGYVEAAPAYYPPGVYVAPPPAYVEAPPGAYDELPSGVYYDEAPPQVYYEAPPTVSIYNGRPHREYRGDRHWHRDREREDDD